MAADTEIRFVVAKGTQCTFLRYRVCPRESVRDMLPLATIPPTASAVAKCRGFGGSCNTGC